MLAIGPMSSTWIAAVATVWAMQEPAFWGPLGRLLGAPTSILHAYANEASFEEPPTNRPDLV